uniref:Inositol polyphosphate-related phosphatase domain-containing protein n=1 Tax=Acrobeloides nanus TaxID=290746 RepID=A0A914C902_9BILA
MELEENLDDQASSSNSSGTLPAAVQADENTANFYSQFNDEEFKHEQNEKASVFGPGGVALPRLSELPELVHNDQIKIMCFTWNICAKPASGLKRMHELFEKIPINDRPDVIAIALQELPNATLKFHNRMVSGIGDAIQSTHRVFCWVRKWTQMLIVFMKKRLCFYTSKPEYQFVSNGRLKNRIADYTKMAKMFNFLSLRPKHDHHRLVHPMKNADHIFWFGDLNFRLMNPDHVLDIVMKLGQNRAFRAVAQYKELLESDELSLGRANGTVFEDFQEGIIMFPPTYKFLTGTHHYVRRRVPAYTDRVVYWSKTGTSITPIRYDCVWDITLSDHKPVYCIFAVKVMENKVPTLTSRRV